MALIYPWQAAVVLWTVLQTRFSIFTPYTLDAFVLDFLLNCVSVLLATTLYSSAPALLIALLLSSAALIYALPSQSRRSQRSVRTATSRPSLESDGRPTFTGSAGLPRQPFVSVYRGCMLIMTCVAILAVDFKIFPRRFGKTETWGQSVMDIGVGSFVFNGALIGARATLKDKEGRQPNQSIGKQLLASTAHSLPIFVLGMIRLLSVKNLDYQEHVTEYGVHWNFFTTLALLPPFAVIFRALFAFVPSYAVPALAVGCLYSGLLEFTDLKKYIISAPRTDLISMNREGICSFFGYLAIYLAGLSVGSSIFAPAAPRKATTPPSKESILSFAGIKKAVHDVTAREPVLSSLLLGTASWSALFWFATSPSSFGLSQTPSRRLANLPYILWVAAFNNGQLLICYLIQLVCFPSPSGKPNGRQTNPRGNHGAKDKEDKEETMISPIVAAFNKNGLVVFIAANLLTGLVNLSFDTLAASYPVSIAILTGYMVILSGIALYCPTLRSIRRRKLDESGGRSSS